MYRLLTFIVALLLSFSALRGGKPVVVADSATHTPLPSASVFDRSGRAIGMTDSRGRLPYISPADFPVTLRYLGFEEKQLSEIAADTVFLAELSTELQEVVIESRQHKVLHVLAYVREYSTLSTYSDTVFLFREKMVDYMMTPDDKVKFTGWMNPRVLKSRSYYRFTDVLGLDSVSRECGNHFSWSDWVGIVPPPVLPAGVRAAEEGTDTLRGRYSPAEIWIRHADRLTVDVDVLADTASRRWVPDLSTFFRKQLDFENFRIRFSYGCVAGDSICVTDLTGYSFNIESNGRGHSMFRFNRRDEPFFVSTFAEVYILDKEYITVKEAKKWAKLKFDSDGIEILEAAEAPELQAPVRDLIARVESIDAEEVRLGRTPDRRYAGGPPRRINFGERALTLLKDLTGITYIRSHRNFNNNWKSFRRSQTGRDRRK